MEQPEKAPFPSPGQLQDELPASEHQRSFIAKSRDTIKQILDGSDQRLLLIAGPCSIHDRTAAIEYAQRLKALAAEVGDTFFVIMRFYTEKSRTSLGWKGMLYDPDLNGSHDIGNGLRLTRQLLLDLAAMEMPAAAELLDPMTAHYYASLLSWACIGARTTESQPHRLMASGLPLPVAFKNNTAGNIVAAINGTLVASQSHTFIGIDTDGRAAIIKTEGNAYAHVTLRGGESAPNYDPASIQTALDGLRRARLPLRVVVDCSHDNSRRIPTNQPHVFESVLKQIIEGNPHIRGVVLESHLNAGNQPLQPGPLHYAVSVTDPCLDWETTVALVHEGRRILRQSAALPSLSRELL